MVGQRVAAIMAWTVTWAVRVSALECALDSAESVTRINGAALGEVRFEPGRAGTAAALRNDATHTNPYYTYVTKGEESADGKYNLETGQLEVVEARQVSVGEGQCKIELEWPNMSVTLVELGR